MGEAIVVDGGEEESGTHLVGQKVLVLRVPLDTYETLVTMAEEMGVPVEDYALGLMGKGY